ncbi:MAG TPA: hybrid sensor histidine kinase/response regulator, partial [Puia sp.]|nr:hybrid sensor histidine kinase/response regulator [Puia sp.]
VGYIVSCSARNIVNNVLDMAGIETGKTPRIVSGPIAVIPFFREVMIVHKTIAANEDKRLRLEIDMPKVIFGDPLVITQILTNLLTNALKYGARGTIIMVRVKRAGVNWEIAVSNYGEVVFTDLNEIFDPFVTGKTGQIQGSGLGLFIVKNKVSQMGGTIRAESHPGGYTTFTVALPLVEGKPSDLPEEGNPNVEVIDLSSIRVLVAEDNNLTAFLLTTFLEDLGCQFEIVSNGRDLLELAQKKSPDEYPDIILLDSRMPVLGGEETIRMLKRLPVLNEIPIIVSTADVYSDALERMLKAGASTYLKKPIDHQALKRAISLYVKKISLE